MSSIRGVGAYAPRSRITADEFTSAVGRFEAKGVREKAVPAADEDVVPMAYEAGTRALDAVELRGEEIEWVGVATSNPPLEEADLTAEFGAMLGVPENVTKHAFLGSTRAGTRAMWAAIDALETETAPGSRPETALVVAADAPRGAPDDAVEHAAGAGAGAFVLESGGPGIIVDRAEYSSPYPGTRFREAWSSETTGLGITHYDRQAFIETVQGAIDGLESDGLEPTPAPDAAAIQAPDGSMPYRAAGAVGIERAAVETCATVHELGDLGAASVPVTLARALADGHERILAVSHGSGAAADAFLVEVERGASVPATLALAGNDSMTAEEYRRRRGFGMDESPAGGGAYVSVPTWRRSLPQRYRLAAGRCLACGSLAFPPEGACPECRALDGYERFELSGTGTIEAVTTIARGGAPPEFLPFQARSGAYATVIVAFEAGSATVSAPAMATGADPASFEIGDRVETTIRRIYTQEGVTRYGFKVRSIDGT